MATVTLDDDFFACLSDIAKNEHKTLEQLFDDWYEDFLDRKAAERAMVILEQIRNGKMETVPWEQVEKELDEMDS
jgi:predicted transcriptional regulator